MKDNKTVYETVSVEVVRLGAADVITTSAAAFNGKDDDIALW